MSDDDDPTYDEFAHRQQSPIKDVPVHRQEVEGIVQELLKLEARTHPQNSDPGEKELDSISALVCAGKLVEKLAGWAMDHRAGMILNDATVFQWPKDDQEASIQANDHRHEAIGSAYLEKGQIKNPIQNRHIVKEVTARAALLPTALRDEISEAIRAIDLGEVRDVFLPAKNQHKNAYTIWSYRLRAIEHVHFLWGEGKTKQEAFDVVALAYGTERRTVDSWDRSPDALKKHFGSKVVKVAQSTAKESGERLQRLQMQLHKSDQDNMHIRSLLSTYGPEALSLNVQRHKEAMLRGSA